MACGANWEPALRKRPLTPSYSTSMVGFWKLFAFCMVGCGGRENTPVATDLDQQTIEEYQAQADGDSYKDYVEPKQ